jgi:hypothetical protein
MQQCRISVGCSQVHQWKRPCAGEWWQYRGLGEGEAKFRKVAWRQRELATAQRLLSALDAGTAGRQLWPMPDGACQYLSCDLISGEDACASATCHGCHGCTTCSHQAADSVLLSCRRRRSSAVPHLWRCRCNSILTRCCHHQRLFGLHGMVIHLPTTFG